MIGIDIIHAMVDRVIHFMPKFFWVWFRVGEQFKMSVFDCDLHLRGEIAEETEIAVDCLVVAGQRVEVSLLC